MAQARSKKLLVEHFRADCSGHNEHSIGSNGGRDGNGGPGGNGHPHSNGSLDSKGRPDANGRKLDFVATEEPLEIRLGDITITTTMRTPGHDFELAAGFCLAEGLLEGGSISAIRYCATGSAVESEFNVVTVEATGDIPEPKPRLGTVTSACGICGSQTIASLCENLSPIDGDKRFPPEVLVAIPSRVICEQMLFAKTGGVHAAAACDADGVPLIVREDIGRHNAVDKVVGRLLLDDKLPSRNPAVGKLCLFVSGRASFEMVQKAWAGGFVSVVSVSSPSSLAVELAQKARIQLAGFARNDRLNLYA